MLTQGPHKPYLPLAAPGDPSVLSEHSPILSQQSLLSVCLWSLWCLCRIATALCLSFTSKLDMNYSHKLILSKYCQKERVIVHCLSTMHQLLHWYCPLIPPTNLSSYFIDEDKTLKCREVNKLSPDQPPSKWQGWNLFQSFIISQQT